MSATKIYETNPKKRKCKIWVRDERYIDYSFIDVKLFKAYEDNKWCVRYNWNDLLFSTDLRAIAKKLDEYNKKKKTNVEIVERRNNSVKNIWIPCEDVENVEDEVKYTKVKLVKKGGMSEWCMKANGLANHLNSNELRAIANKLDKYNKNG